MKDLEELMLGNGSPSLGNERVGAEQVMSEKVMVRIAVERWQRELDDVNHELRRKTRDHFASAGA